MKHVIDDIERQLTTAIETDQRRSAPARTARAIGPRRALTVASTVAVAVAVGLATLSSGPGPDSARATTLPILRQPAVDASALRDGLPPAERRDLAFDQARAFRSALGTGYVLPSQDGRRLCITLPDEPGAGAGIACDSRARAEARGLTITRLVVEGMPGNSEIAAALPANAQRPTVTYRNGESDPLSVRRGVAVIDVKRDLTVSWRIADGETVRRSVQAVAPEGAAYFDCGKPTGIVKLQKGESFDRSRVCGD